MKCSTRPTRGKLGWRQRAGRERGRIQQDRQRISCALRGGCVATRHTLLAWIYRRAVSNLIGRVRKVGFGETSVDVTPVIAELQRHAEEGTLLRLTQALAPLPDSPFQQFVRNAVATNSEQLQLHGAEERATYYLRVLALLGVLYEFERVYRMIFGSQIELMRSAVPGPVTAETARRLYDRAPVRTALPDFTFEQWLGFLVETGWLA